MKNTPTPTFKVQVAQLARHIVRFEYEVKGVNTQEEANQVVRDKLCYLVPQVDYPNAVTTELRSGEDVEYSTEYEDWLGFGETLDEAIANMEEF